MCGPKCRSKRIHAAPFKGAGASFPVTQLLYGVEPLLPLVRTWIALSMFAVAAGMDLKKREVDDRLWLAFGAPAAALYFFDHDSFDLVMALMSMVIAGSASYALYKTGMFGGADAFAVVALSVIMPTYDGRFILTGAPLAHSLAPLALLSNAVLVSLIHPLFNLARNLAFWARHREALFAGMEGETAGRKALALVLGHRSSGKGGFGFLMEATGGAGTRRFDFALKNAEETPFESRKGVWVMPGMPFLLYMLAGLVVLVLAGDIAFLALSSLAG